MDSESSDRLTIISHAEMSRAVDEGRVQDLARSIPFIRKYEEGWWVAYEGGWIRADPLLAEMLERDSRRLMEQEKISALDRKGIEGEVGSV
ncbi:hypothetical protein [Actinomadura atramentaria]|uniref:hypothetical protein n=1 Tax=Actinomadura atramentaria TaxID=1990 RepID=UPI000377969E|nr:hypothetical protein [Actinomadura atramentaria]